MFERCQPILQVLKIAAQHRPDVGVDHRGAQAVKFFDLRNDLGRERGVHTGELGPDYLANPVFVVGVQVREQEADGQGFHAFFFKLV